MLDNSSGLQTYLAVQSFNPSTLQQDVTANDLSTPAGIHFASRSEVDKDYRSEKGKLPRNSRQVSGIKRSRAPDHVATPETVCLLQQHNQAPRHRPASVVALPLAARHASIILDSNSRRSPHYMLHHQITTIRLRRRASVKCCPSQVGKFYCL